MPTEQMQEPDLSQKTVTQLAELNAAGMDVQKIIAHVFSNNASLDPLRKKAADYASSLESDGQAMIDALAKQAAALKAEELAGQASKLTMQEAVLARQAQLGFDVANPASDRLAQLANWIAEESDAARASTEKIQALDSVSFAGNPLQWLINQFKIDSEKDTLATATKAKDSYLTEMGALHRLAQENVQTITQSKLAKTSAELQATLDKQASEAARAAIEHKIRNGATNLSAISQIYNMTADEHSVWFKAAQLAADQANRQRDAKQDELRYKMLELQFANMQKEASDKAALVQSMREHAVNNLGADPRAVVNAPDDAILNNKSVKDSYFATFGIGHPPGPMTALNAIESQNNPNNYLASLMPAKWIRGKLVDLRPPVELLKRPKEEQDKWYDEQLIRLAEEEMKGDADNSLLLRIPSVGELKYMAGQDSKALQGNSLIRYIATAPDTNRYSIKQIIGFAIKDPALKSNGAARAKLITDIVKLAQVSVNYNDGTNMHSKFGLPKVHASSIGYKIMPKELLDAVNANVPEATARRYFDMTKTSDVQTLVNLVLNPPNKNMLIPEVFNFGGSDLGGTLRQPDPLSPSGAKKAGSKNKKEEK